MVLSSSVWNLVITTIPVLDQVQQLTICVDALELPSDTVTSARLPSLATVHFEGVPSFCYLDATLVHQLLCSIDVHAGPRLQFANLALTGDKSVLSSFPLFYVPSVTVNVFL